VKPRKRFGQHFLHDPAVLRRIVDEVDPAPGDTLIEIGPGEGALTRPLLERAERLTVIEIDRDLAAALAEKFPAPRLSVVSADALEHDFSAYPPGFRIVGNLPYNVSTPILFHLLGCADRVRDMHFMLQKEVVERMVARPSTPDYGRLSVMLQVRFAMTRLFDVGPGAFRPPPKVDSSVVRMVPLRGKPDWDANLLEKIVREAFSARRKTLRNALKNELRRSPQLLAELGIDPQLRPENLSPADYVRITKACAR
jgi:16S rRNA (adenine1518-N6/adenine1519-N6)-dimethyltransferase